MQTTCIIGGGPAGMVLGLLLARAGLPVTVLEKHLDFFRDFRGDTIHPSTLQILHELGLLEKFLQIPHSELHALSAVVGGRKFPLADFSGLPTVAKYVAQMPQWDFLSFLAAEAAKYPTFTLRMGWDVTGLLQENGVTKGVQVKTPEGASEIRADLTVGCDGRHAVSREAAHFKVIDEGVPVDILWFRLARKEGDPDNALGYFNYGRFVILINRGDFFQIGYIIAKGDFDRIKGQGLAPFHASLERIVPCLAGRTGEIDTWDKVKLLTIQLNHLERWSSPGLLCIGDAAHAMSPAFGIGVNIAVQDAVATANLLIEPLRAGTVTTEDLAGVQAYREPAVRQTQWRQARVHGVLEKVLRHEGAVTPPLALRIATRIPGFQKMVGSFIGLGLQPQHIKA